MFPVMQVQCRLLRWSLSLHLGYADHRTFRHFFIRRMKCIFDLWSGDIVTRADDHIITAAFKPLTYPSFVHRAHIARYVPPINHIFSLAFICQVPAPGRAPYREPPYSCPTSNLAHFQEPSMAILRIHIIALPMVPGSYVILRRPK